MSRRIYAISWSNLFNEKKSSTPAKWNSSCEIKAADDARSQGMNAGWERAKGVERVKEWPRKISRERKKERHEKIMHFLSRGSRSDASSYAIASVIAAFTKSDERFFIAKYVRGFIGNSVGNESETRSGDFAEMSTHG